MPVSTVTSRSITDSSSSKVSWVRRLAMAVVVAAATLVPTVSAAVPASASLAGCLAADVVGIAATPTNSGYWLVAADGGVFSFGDARFFGSMAGTPMNRPVVGLVPTASGQGYWLIGADGGIFSFGDAVPPPWNPLPGMTLNGPVVGAARLGGTGLVLAGADGGVFALGGAPFLGGMGGSPLNKPISSIVATVSGGGYWLIGADGGVFSFGDAQYPAGNQLPATALAAPVVAASTIGATGLELTAADGGVFALGGAPFKGNATALRLAKPIAGIASAGQNGYWLAARDGGVFGYGPSAGFYGNATSSPSCTTAPASPTTTSNTIVATATAIMQGKAVTNWAGGTVPYSWGGGHKANFGPSGGTCTAYTGPRPCVAPSTIGVDCSGFARWVYAIVYGKDVLGGGNTDSQLRKMHKVDQPQPGDLVFYGYKSGSTYVTHHVGIYIGNGKMIDALKTGTNVRQDNVSVMNDLLGYWRY